MRIKLPKLLKKEMMGRDEKSKCTTNDDSFEAKHKSFMQQKIGSILSKTLRRKKSKNLSPDMTDHPLDPAIGHCLDSPKENKNSGAIEGCIEAPGHGSRKPKLSVSHSIKGMLENLGKSNGEKNSEKLSDAGITQALTISLTSRGLVGEKGSDNHVHGKQRRSKIVPRSSSKKHGGNMKMKSPKLEKNKAMKEGEETGDEDEKTGKMELCKRRILMGERCRPLNKSGVLHYDDNGILLPEEIRDLV